MTQLVKIVSQAIDNRQLMRFYYESSSSGKKEWRTVEPYILAKKHNGNVFLAALPLEELKKNIADRNTGHYLLSKMDINQLEILPEKYDEPKVARERITDTPTIKVICRYIYKDEKEDDSKEK
jgi:hypothetical protein